VSVLTLRVVNRGAYDQLAELGLDVTEIVEEVTGLNLPGEKPGGGVEGTDLEGNTNLAALTGTEIASILDELVVRPEREPLDDGYLAYQSQEHRFPWDNLTSCWSVREQNIYLHVDRVGEFITLLNEDQEPTSDIDQACYVGSARIYDPWMGITIEYSRDVDGTTFPLDTEHITPWAEAWRSGAWKLSEDLQRDAYNDALNLVPVDPGVNRGQHSDHPFGQWELPNDEALCFYATRVVQFKQKWDLTVWGAEARAIREATIQC